MPIAIVIINCDFLSTEKYILNNYNKPKYGSNLIKSVLSSVKEKLIYIEISLNEFFFYFSIEEKFKNMNL